jgi:oxygen-independent coproporphyrinogen III oxidase
MDLGGVYLHVPFCKRKCSYCDFVSFEKEVSSNYLELVFQEYLMYPASCHSITFDTFFIGGGTPSLACPQDFKPIIDHFLSQLQQGTLPELTIESNPESLTKRKLQDYFNLGINRISIGVQSFDPVVLTSSGRLHNQKEAIFAVETAYKIGFRNINIDLISGLPGESEKTLEINQSILDALPLTHLSCYFLDLSPKTPMYKMIEQGTLMLPEESKSMDLHHQFLEYLHSSSWKHYEISNFCKIGYECKHNLHYWKGDPYLGLGISAVSYLPPWRKKNTIQLGRYTSSIGLGKSASVFNERIDSRKTAQEKIMLGLRLLDEGISCFDIHANKMEQAQYWLDKDFLKKKDTRLLLTQKGVLYANQITASLF